MMDWQTGTILVVVLACVIPGILALLPQSDKRRFTQRDHVAAKHRAIANRALRTRAGIR